VVHFLATHSDVPGTRIYLNWTSANRDEAVFGDADAKPVRETYPRGGWRRVPVRLLTNR
jgi:hypothetical protein